VSNGGGGFIATPAISFSGGGGTGATAVANMSGGAIASVTVTAPGSGYTSVPAVIVSPGFNNAASATLSLMPYGISGTSIETFLNRVWISSGAQNGSANPAGTFVVSAPGSVTNFATSAGGLLYSSSDRFLRATYTALRQSNGYLYPMGDSSVSVISNVQTSGNPSSTTFNYQNTNSQIGAAWRDSIQDFGQSVLFANENGIQGIYGGDVRRVSSKINDLFDNAIFPPSGSALLPSSAVANIHTIPVYLLLMTVVDPNTMAPRNVMVAWDQKNYFVATQSVNLTFIGTQEQNSAMTAWGTDGISLYPLFAQPSTSLAKTIATKLYGGEREMVMKQTLLMFYRITDKSPGQSGVALTATMQGEGWNTQAGAYPSGLSSQSAQNLTNPNIVAPNGTLPSWGGQTANVPGTAIGAVITSTSADFLLSGLSLAYRDIEAMVG